MIITPYLEDRSPDLGILRLLQCIEFFPFFGITGMNSNHLNEPHSTDRVVASADRTATTTWNGAVTAILLFALASASAFLGERCVAAFQEFFYPPPHGQVSDPPDYLLAIKRSMMANMAIGYGLFGAMCFSFMGALLGQSHGRASCGRGLLIGSLVGILSGALTAPLGYYIQNTYQQVDMEPTVKASFVLGWTFIGFGVGGGLLPVLLGITRGVGKAIFIGIGVGVFALVLHLVLATALFPIDPPEMMFSFGYGIRLLAMNMMAAASATAALLVLRESIRTKAISNGGTGT
ncbi:MAG: hypothetical protein KatS3mg111_3608 [Pirellulaceae bacterium]|nr:MAG: hypothetical protein KatS3mg111_3608 [Pirellulaceae bacterium]